MGYSCKILLDSISETGKRLTTLEITFPRIVLAEFNTHRMFSRNSASSRAIPFKKQLQRVMLDPFIPERFPINGKGMQPQGYYDRYTSSFEYKVARQIWLDARDEAIRFARELTGEHVVDFNSEGEPLRLSVHKQIANRLLEPFMWHTVIVTATEFDNFFKLRTHTDAQAEIKQIADLMYSAYHAFDKEFPSVTKVEGAGWEAIRPQVLKRGEWHLPLFNKQEDLPLVENLWYSASGDLFKWITNLVGLNKNVFIEIPKMVSVARCARVSYLTHDGKRDIVKDLELFEKLVTQNHWSPTEHVATPYFERVGTFDPDFRPDGNCVLKGLGVWDRNLQSGNFCGWKQCRKEFQNENCVDFRKD